MKTLALAARTFGDGDFLLYRQIISTEAADMFKKIEEVVCFLADREVNNEGMWRYLDYWYFALNETTEYASDTKDQREVLEAKRRQISDRLISYQRLYDYLLGKRMMLDGKESPPRVEDKKAAFMVRSKLLDNFLDNLFFLEPGDERLVPIWLHITDSIPSWASEEFIGLVRGRAEYLRPELALALIRGFERRVEERKKAGTYGDDLMFGKKLIRVLLISVVRRISWEGLLPFAEVACEAATMCGGALKILADDAKKLSQLSRDLERLKELILKEFSSRVGKVDILFGADRSVGMNIVCKPINEACASPGRVYEFVKGVWTSIKTSVILPWRSSVSIPFATNARISMPETSSSGEIGLLFEF